LPRNLVSTKAQKLLQPPGDNTSFRGLSPAEIELKNNLPIRPFSLSVLSKQVHAVAVSSCVSQTSPCVPRKAFAAVSVLAATFHSMRR
jgi:hypothetical protein